MSLNNDPPFIYRFAFVEFDDRKHAEEAKEQYNGFDVEGRRLKLDWDIGLGKKDIKPARAAATLSHQNTAESTPQPSGSQYREGSESATNGDYHHTEASAAAAAAESTNGGATNESAVAVDTSVQDVQDGNDAPVEAVDAR